MSDELDLHYEMVAAELLEGRVVPLLGAGVSAAADGTGPYPPTGRQLAKRLARRSRYPGTDELDLIRISQYVATMIGSGPLYAELRSVFATDFLPTPVHRLLAALPAVLRRHEPPVPLPLIVTTNYDDSLERAFHDAGEPFDLVTYIAEGDHGGKFVHHPHGGEPVLIDVANQYHAGSLDERTVILKLHGAVDRADAAQDSYVITEDHYIDYLTRTDPSTLVPVQLARRLSASHLLFLGYSLQDWNVRVILHRIWRDQTRSFTYWAVQRSPQEIDRRFWRTRGVEIFDVDLRHYVAELQSRVLARPDEDAA